MASALQGDERRVEYRHRTEGTTLSAPHDLNRFLAGVERRALVHARLATGSADEALDIVQDAMLKLATHYADRGEQEWGPLFHTILQSRIRDWYRRNRVRRNWLSWFGAGEEDEGDPLDRLPNPKATDPVEQAARNRALAQLEPALARLPLRQRQAFLLRVWEGLDVAATARAMQCSEGSVKTHLSRALGALREALGEDGMT